MVSEIGIFVTKPYILFFDNIYRILNSHQLSIILINHLLSSHGFRFLILVLLLKWKFGQIYLIPYLLLYIEQQIVVLFYLILELLLPLSHQLLEIFFRSFQVLHLCVYSGWFHVQQLNFLLNHFLWFVHLNV